MTWQKGILTIDPNLAHALAYQVRALQDLNAVIFPQETDGRAVKLACDLVGISEANSCPIRAKCRIKPSDQNAPRIYVACLSAYTNGYLHGWWIDADQDPDEIWSDIKDMLADSPMDDAEEWAIHDYENFGAISISENPDLEQLSIWANLISEDSENAEAVAAYIGWAQDVGLEISTSEFQSRYCGHWKNGEDFALNSEEVAELYNWGKFQEEFTFWSMYIDWASVGRDLEFSDAYHYARADHGIYVFRYC
ncbi:MAG: antirestriction protein ArdA [Symploca sp. SIO1C4]|uniref:Antirestriction protein ArdA n=1 Tax=Symploca sp. SIO1C4 TaxID=2607765 RepID=A0A6B3NDY4_9CYAN|nr:antirestriction protein ArdA [Symploca sp. SIO1C4]